LALWQAHSVQEILARAEINATCQIIHTTGDLQQQKALHQLGTVGIFTKALDQALLEGRIQLAVHSAKDMPASLHEELELLACLKREDPRDALLAAKPEVSLENVTQNWVVGTSSLRRTAFLKYYLPHIVVKNIRGNIDTRLEKMMNGDYDAILLACAGVKRMGLEKYIVQKLNVNTFTPAVAQGAIAVVCRKDLPRKEALRKALNHIPTELAVSCERQFLHTVAGGCSIPVFGLATVTGNTIGLTAGIADTNGKLLLRTYQEGPLQEALKVGRLAGEDVQKKMEAHNLTITMFNH